MDTEPIIQIMQQMPETIDCTLNIFFVAGVEALWSIWGSYIIGVLIFTAFIILIQLVVGSPNIMPPWINSFVGKVTRLSLIALCFAIFYKMFGALILDENIIKIFGEIAFALTGSFLMGIGFWQYKPPSRVGKYYYKTRKRCRNTRYSN